jgi:hypothetical protein
MIKEDRTSTLPNGASMNVIPTEYTAGGGISPLALSVIHGVVLALLLIGLLRLPSWLPFARIVKALIAVFILFLLIDDLVNGSLSAGAGLLCAAGLTLAIAALFRRRHHGGHVPG